MVANVIKNVFIETFLLSETSFKESSSFPYDIKSLHWKKWNIVLINKSLVNY